MKISALLQATAQALDKQTCPHVPEGAPWSLCALTSAVLYAGNTLTFCPGK